MPFVTCPNCEAESTAPRELIGLEWNCPNCRTSFVVEDDDVRAPLRRRRRSNSGPIWAMVGLAVAGVFAFGVLALAFSRSDRPEQKVGEPAVKAAPKEEAKPAEPSTSPLKTAFGIVQIVFVVAFYMAPTIVAVARGHNNIAPIAVVNFLLGCTVIGWIIALSWAFTDLKHLESRRRSYL